jgi:predicted heme/steroid binding protein
VGLRQGAQVRFSSSALTYRNIGESISAFVIVTGQVYLISEVFMDQAGLTWYALQAQEEDSVGWINEEQLPPHEILP